MADTISPCSSTWPDRTVFSWNAQTQNMNKHVTNPSPNIACRSTNLLGVIHALYCCTIEDACGGIDCSVDACFGG